MRTLDNSERMEEGSFSFLTAFPFDCISLEVAGERKLWIRTCWKRGCRACPCCITTEVAFGLAGPAVKLNLQTRTQSESSFIRSV